MFVRTIHGRVAGWGFLFAIAAVVILSNSDLIAQPWSSNPFDPTLTRPANAPPKQTSASVAAAFTTNPFKRPNISALPAVTTSAGGISSSSALGTQSGTGTIAAGGLIRTGMGAGTLTLSSSNTYTGTTTVNAGTLTVGNATINTGSIVMAHPIEITGAKVTIKSFPGGSISGDAIFDTTTHNVTLNSANSSVLKLSSGSVTVSGNASINSGILQLAPISGSSVGTIDLTSGTLTPVHLGTISNGLGTLTLANSGSGCFVSLSGLSLDNTLGGVLNISDISVPGSAFQVATGELTATSITSNTMTIGAGAHLTIHPIDGEPLLKSGSLTPVPEPSTIVLIFLAGLGLLTARKLRHNFRL
jgi:autotransporter-associated beta strand protein